MKLLIIAHTPSSNTRLLADSLFSSARSAAENSANSLDIELKNPFQVDAEVLRTADGVILLTTENFGYMSGALKDMFDRTYYDIIDNKRGMPYSLIVRAGKDGTGARRAVESIIKGLGWRAVQDCLVLKGPFDQHFIAQVAYLGEAFALGLSEGMF